jgi:hypothetical protein
MMTAKVSTTPTFSVSRFIWDCAGFWTGPRPQKFVAVTITFVLVWAYALYQHFAQGVQPARVVSSLFVAGFCLMLGFTVLHALGRAAAVQLKRRANARQLEFAHLLTVPQALLLALAGVVFTSLSFTVFPLTPVWGILYAGLAFRLLVHKQERTYPQK